MQNLKNDPEKVLEALMPEILSDEDFVILETFRSSTGASWADFIVKSLRLFALAMADPQGTAKFLQRKARGGEEAQ